jgi:hypothetical protein
VLVLIFLLYIYTWWSKMEYKNKIEKSVKNHFFQMETPNFYNFILFSNKNKGDFV